MIDQSTFQWPQGRSAVELSEEIERAVAGGDWMIYRSMASARAHIAYISMRTSISRWYNF